MNQLFLLRIVFAITLVLASPAFALKIFDVDAYGATANDFSDDDRAAIQSAIDDAIDWKNTYNEDTRLDFGTGRYHFA